MNKNARKLIPAVAMLLVSASMLSTASYAWFSMNNKVTAGGMNVNVVTPGSLMIASTKDGNYSTTADLNETTARKLAPVSTIDALKFFMAKPSTVEHETNTASAITANTVIKEIVASAPSENQIANTEDGIRAFYGVEANPWVDYTFYLTTTTTTDVYITLDNVMIELKNPDEAVTNIQKALRVAILSGNETDGFSIPEKADTNDTNTAVNKHIWAEAGDYNVDGTAWNAIKTATNTTTTPTGTVAIFDKTSTDTYLFKLAASTTAGEVTKDNAQAVTIRVWLEGESENCTMALADTKDMEVSVSFKLVEYKPTLPAA